MDKIAVIVLLEMDKDPENKAFGIEYVKNYLKYSELQESYFKYFFNVNTRKNEYWVIGGSAGGAYAGGQLGAAAGGTVAGPPGAAIGGIAGSIIGGIAGSEAGEAIGESIDDFIENDTPIDILDPCEPEEIVISPDEIPNIDDNNNENNQGNQYGPPTGPMGLQRNN